MSDPAQNHRPADPEIEGLIDGIIEREGREYTNRPADKGGPTKFGITLETLSEFRGYPVSPQEVRDLQEPEVRQIYRQLYVFGPGFDRIADRILRVAVIDAGVNHGQGWAARRLQEAAGVKADGAIGPVTLAAVNVAEPQDIALRFAARRYQKYANIVVADLKERGRLDGTQAENLRGWINRANEMLLMEVAR